MESEERNAAMDTILNEISKPGGSWHLYGDMPGDDAIRECDKKARAWDVVYKEMQEQTGPCGAWHREFMDQALTPPQPKDPLEELEEHVQKNKWSTLPGKWVVDAEPLFSKIRRLKDKK